MRTKITLFFRSCLPAVFGLLILFANQTESNASAIVVSSTYSFTAYATSVYTPLSPSQGTALRPTSGKNQNTVYAVPIGFNFSYNGKSYNSLWVSTSGFIAFNNTALTGTAGKPAITLSTPLTTSFAGDSGVVAGFAGKLLAGPNADLRYMTNAGSINPRFLVFTLQWTNYQVSTTDNFNFQIRLNQVDNSIEILYGTMTTTASNATAIQVGLKGLSNATDINCRNVTSGSAWTSSARTSIAAAPYGPGLIPLGLAYLWTIPSVEAGIANGIIQDTIPVGTTGTGGSVAALISGTTFNSDPAKPVNLLYTVNSILQGPVSMSLDSSAGSVKKYHGTLPAITAQHADISYFESYTNTEGFEVRSGDVSYRIGSLVVTPSSNAMSFKSGIGTIALSHTQTTSNVKLRAACTHSPIKITQVALDMFEEGRTAVYPYYVGDSIPKNLVEIRNLSTTALDITGFTFVFESLKEVRTFAIPANGPPFYALASCIINIGAALETPDDSAHHFYNMGGTQNPVHPSDPCGFILKNQNGDVIDAFAANGFIFDGSQGELAADWFGIAADSCKGKAGYIRNKKTDHNCKSDWIVADSGHVQTIGATHYMLDSAFQAPLIKWHSSTYGDFTGETITIPPLANGSYNFTTTVIQDVDSATTPLTIQVHAPVLPHADFYADNTNPFVGDVVTFHDSSGGDPEKWSWYFGDGATSAIQNPAHQYSSPGAYGVILIASNADGADTAIKVNYITVHSFCGGAPATPGVILDSTGTNTACPGDLRQYVISSVTGADSYHWTPPVGASVNSGQGTTQVMILYDNTFVSSGTLSVTAVNGCGSSAARTLAIARNVPATPGTISIVPDTFPSHVCPGDVRTYSVAAVATATFYTWTAPTGSHITAGQGSRQVTIVYDNTFVANGTLSVKAANGCGSSAARTLTITRNVPSEPGTITESGGSAAACWGDVRTYSVPLVQGLTYSWTPPAHVSLACIGSCNTVTAHFLSGFTGGALKVTATNGCGTSAARSLTIAKRATPAPGTITESGVPAGAGTNAVCPGDIRTFSVINVAGTLYTWTPPTGSSIQSGQGTHSISLKFLSAFTSNGPLKVTAQDSCGTSAASSLTITRNVPATPSSITGLSTVPCFDSLIYSVTGDIYNSYLWTVPPGSHILSTTGTSINVLMDDSSGNVTVKVSNTCGTSGTRSKAINITCIGRWAAPAGAENTSTVVYPNPSNGIATLRFNSDIAGKYRIQLMDIMGRVVKSEEADVQEGINLHELNLVGFSKGIYVLTIESSEKREQLKVVLQ